MSLATGTRIGPYEIVAPLGAGGMGEVFRARDTRLGRDVALKTLPHGLSKDRERLERFEREARAAGALQHPGIVVLFDIGTHEERPYIVTELVDGHSLRTLIQSAALKPARAVEIAIALADALGAAHALGIVHRDVKPENVLVARDGRVKLLDFGLAKLLQSDAGNIEDTSARTMDGTVLGTAAYIAPEQARGEPADHRVDLFALACVIHEMLTGQSPFHRDSMADTLAAVLKEDPPPLPAAARAALPGLDVLLRRCFEKRPGDRFESARDLACALEALRTSAQSGVTTTDSGRIAVTTAAPVRYRRITYRRGTVVAARFMPDGPGIVYAALWEGRPHELFWVFGGATESRPLGIQDATLLGISRSSELAIGRTYRPMGAFINQGMLARVPLGAGSPRDIRADVQYADWSPDGQLAVVTAAGGSNQIEYPIGRTLYRSDGGWFSEMRFSRDGRHIAFIDHPIRGDDAGAVAVVDMDGKVRRFQHYSGTLRGLAWGPGDREVWFTGASSGTNRALRAVTLEGDERVLLQMAGGVLLHDVATDGRVLISHGDERLGMQFGSFDPLIERDLSWFDWSLLRDISRDGNHVLFDESGEGAGPSPQICIRGTDGTPASRIGDGVGMQFSPDERSVLGIPIGTAPGTVVILPVGAGTPRTLRFPDHDVHLGGWFPDGQSLWVAANRGGESIRIVRMTLADEKFAPITDPGVGGFECRITPDGRAVFATGAEYHLYPVDGGEPSKVQGVLPMDRPVGFSADATKVYVFERASLPARVCTVDLATGERTHWRDIGPSDLSGVWSVAPVRLSADFNRYAYSYGRLLFDLFEVSGLS